MEPGLVWAPWVVPNSVNVVTSGSSNHLTKNGSFNKYYENHKYCPKCGGDKYNTTLVGYPFVVGKEDEYQDLNRCCCSGCGDKHTTHDRVSIQFLREKKISSITK